MPTFFSNYYRRLVLILMFFCVSQVLLSQTANFTINNTSQCLAGNSFVFTNTSSNTATAYQWNFGDGNTSTATNPTKTYTYAGNYSVQLIATIAGIDYYINKTVEVNPMPQCGFTFIAATSTGNSYTFLSYSSIASGSMNYSWDFGDGGTATSSNPTHTYSANGSYVTTLTITSDKGCVCSVSKTVLVTVSSGGFSPGLSFAINSNSQCVTGNNFSFTNTTAAISGATYRWTFGDGNISNAANPSHSYASAGTYIVNLIATIGGQDYYYPQQITVTPTPTASIAAGTYCVGSPISVTTSATNVSSIQWKNGASVVGTNTPTWNTTYSIVAGNNGAGTNANQLQGAKGIYVDKFGNLYVIDNYQSRVQKWTVGAISGVTVATGLQITGVGVDDAGNVYTVDDINNWVQKWTIGSLTPATVAGGNGSGSGANQFNNPRGNLYIDASGNIYINDLGNNRIQKWAPAAIVGNTVAGGNGSGSAANQFNGAYSFFVDASGNIYVADQGNYRIQLWTVGATSGITVAGGNGNGSSANQFDAGADLVYVDANGNMYGVDRFQGRIQLWIAGASAGITAFGGTYGAAPHDQPFLFINTNTGDIFVLDQANNRVIKYSTFNVTNTYTPTSTGTYTAVVNTFGGCNAISNAVTVVNCVTPAITINAGTSCQASICAGSSVTFNSNITNGGTSPSYQWKINGNNVGTGSSFTTNSLNNNDIVTCILTNNDIGATPNNVTSNSITMKIYAAPIVSITNNGCISGGLSISGTGTIGSTVTWLLAGTPVFTSTPAWDTIGITVAGNPTSGSSASELNSPSDVFIDANNNIYVCDIYNNRIQKFPAGSVGGTSATTVAGGNGNGYANNQLQNAYGFTLDASNNIYITNSFAHRIDKYVAGASSGTTIAGVSASPGLGANQFTLPKRMVLDKCGNMYIADSYNHRVQKFAIGSTVGVTVAGGNGNGNAANQLSYPTDVALDDAGNLYVCDNENHRIQKFAPNSTNASNGVTVAGGNGQGNAPNQLNSAWGFTADGAGNLLIADTYNNRIMYWAIGASTGVKLAGGNGYGTTGYHFNYPTNVALDNAGNFYVADEHNNRVQKFILNSTVTFAPITPGTYTAIVTNNSGCSATTSAVTVATCTVVTPPSLSFTVNTTSQCITGNNFVFTNTSTAPSGTTYSWSFGDGSNSTTASPTHTYTTAGYYNVQMIATYNGQSYYANSLSVYVGAKPIANFTQYYNSPLTYTFNSTSTVASGSITNYAWNFGDGASATTSNPQHAFASAGTYNVKLVVTSDAGCKDSITTAVTISNSNGGTGGGSTPSPSFTVNSTSQCITGNSFVFTNTSTSPSGTTYSWNFGDGSNSTATSPTHTYTIEGYYNVQMIATYNGQTYYANSLSVYVGAKPVTNFTQYYNSPLTYTFNSTSTVASGSITNYAWSFGDGATGTTSNPQHAFASAGTYNVKLVVTSDAGCKDSITTAVTISNSNGGGGGGGTTPSPSFTVNLTNQCITGNSFVFTNTTSPAPTGTTYLWNFGDGLTSTIANPTHVYTTAGYYYVSMTATFNNQTYYASGKSIVVGAKPNASFYSTANTGSGNAYTFISTSTIANGSMSYAWDFGDGGISTLVSPTHIFGSAGTMNVKLVITSDLGCKDSVTQVVVICPTFTNPAFTINSASSCFVGNYFGVQNYYGNTAGYPMTYLWNYGDGSTSTSQNPSTHSYAAVGTYNISLSTTLAYSGCATITSSYTTPVTVNPMPVAGFNISGSPTAMCYTPTNNYTFNNTTSIANGSMSFNWNFGDTTFSTLYSPSHSFSHAGYNSYWETTYGEIPIKLIVTSDNNCRDSITKTVTLYPVPTATKLNIRTYYGTATDHPLYREFEPTYFFHSFNYDDTINCFNGYHWYGHDIIRNATSPADKLIYSFDNSTNDTTLSGGLYHGQPYHQYTTVGTHPVSAYILSLKGCASNVVSSRVTITPNTDTMPHSVIGLHPVITTNVGVDPLGFTYNHYKLYFAHLGYSACRPIISTDWRFSYLSGNDPYWNHGYFDYGSYTGIKPLVTDSTAFEFNGDTSITYQVRLITMNDLGMRDTAYATFGANNSGYTNYRAATNVIIRNITAYPNPAKSFIKLAVKLEKNYYTNLYVYDMLGKIVLMRKDYLLGNIAEEIKLNISTLPAGLYYIKLNDNKNNQLADTKFLKTN